MINKDSKVVLDIVEGYLNRALGVKVVKPYDDSEYRDYFITSTGKTVEGFNPDGYTVDFVVRNLGRVIGEIEQNPNDF